MIKFNSKKFKGVALMAFALMANVAGAQSFKVTADGKPVSNGDVLEIGWEYTVDDSYFEDWGIITYTYKWDPHLYVAASEGEVPLSVTVKSLNGTQGFQICWPMNCQFVSPDGSKTATGTVKTTPQDLEIHKEYNGVDETDLPTDGGEVKVTIASGSETVEVTVKALLADAAVGGNIAESNAAPEYYTIQGIRVAEPQKGQLVIERKGSKVVKRIF